MLYKQFMTFVQAWSSVARWQYRCQRGAVGRVSHGINFH